MIHPVFPSIRKDELIQLDLSVTGEHVAHIDIFDTAQFTSYLFDEVLQGKVGIGGYLEHRNFYARSPHFETNTTDFRNIHLGIDIWTDAGRAIHAPLTGKVHSYANNTGYGNYGSTIILEHEWEGSVLYSLYGHLAAKSLAHISNLTKIDAGQCIGWLGHPEENGNWPPHLHFQFMYSMQEWKGDYPGVCSTKELPFYQSNCPNPMDFLRFTK
ncbi:MAG: peptidoglycan DD-metalloendopeptidase family protein [Saprospiraceae bacterium]|nr:peptidoglycan DD-metalloendopeptidase family protein [Saprospiraceae bacterium]